MAGAGVVALPPIGSARAAQDPAPLGLPERAQPVGAPSATASPPARRWGKRRQVPAIPGGGVRPAAPIWLGTADWEEPVQRPRAIHELVPEEDLVSFDIARAVREIERLEVEARAQEHAGKYAQAQELLEKSVELRRLFLGDSHEEAVSAAEAHVGLCNQWGLCLLASGNYAHALLFLKRAEALTEAGALPNSRRRLELRAATFNNMACYFRARGKLSAALQCMEKSLAVTGRCRDAENLALLQLNYAVLLSMANRPQEALDHIEAAKASLVPCEKQMSQLLKKGSFYPNHFQLERQHQEAVALLSVAHYNAWIELTQLGLKDAAVDSVRRAINIVRWKLGETHPLTSKVRQAISMAEKRVEASSAADAPSPRLSLSPAPSRASLASRSVDEMASSRWRPRPPGGEPWPVAPPMSQSLGLAAVEPAERVTMRCSPRASTRTPGPPAGGPPPQERPRPDLKGQVYKRPQGLLRGGARTPLFSDRPRIEDGDGYVGSALLQQKAHGVRPLSCATVQASPSPDSACMQDLQSIREAEAPVQDSEEAGPSRLHAIGYLRSCQAQGLVARSPTEAELTRAAARIQAQCRGHLARKGACGGDHPGGGEEDIGQVDSARRIALEVAGIARWALVDHNAAVAVQRVWRGHQTRQRIKEEVALVATTSAMKLQRFYRRRLRDRGA